MPFSALTAVLNADRESVDVALAWAAVRTLLGIVTRLRGIWCDAADGSTAPGTLSSGATNAVRRNSDFAGFVVCACMTFE